MKKTIPALLLACVLFACKKDTTSNESPASQSKVPVKFSVHNFLISQEEMSNNGRVETDPTLIRFTRLSYLAFGSDGNRVSRIWQTASDNPNDFGVISDSLAPGTYTIVIGATTFAGLSDISDYGLNNSYFRVDPISQEIGDLFYKKIQITVSENGNPPTMDLVLNRVVGQLKIELKDALPASDPNGAVTVNVFGVPTDLMFSTDLTRGAWYDLPLNRTSLTTWDWYILGSSQKLQVVLGWKDKVTGAAQSKTIQNVLVTANKKTIITGYLYGTPENLGGSDYVVRTNPDWSTDSTVIKIN
jgi:hypothetical protein